MALTFHILSCWIDEYWVEGQASLDENSVSATLRCLWYLQVSDRQVHFLIIHIVGLNVSQALYDCPSIMIPLSLLPFPHPDVTTLVSPGLEIVLPRPILPLSFLRFLDMVIVPLRLIREPKRYRLIPLTLSNRIIGASEQVLGFQHFWQTLPTTSDAALLKFFQHSFLKLLLLLVFSRPWSSLSTRKSCREVPRRPTRQGLPYTTIWWSVACTW